MNKNDNNPIHDSSTNNHFITYFTHASTSHSHAPSPPRQIKKIKEEDTGKYRCTVDFGGDQKINAEVPVHIQKSPYFTDDFTKTLTVSSSSLSRFLKFFFLIYCYFLRFFSFCLYPFL